MWLLLLKKALPSLIAVALILASGYCVYSWGYGHGARDVQLEWQQDREAARVAYDLLLEQVAEREAAYQVEQKRIVHELATAQTQHEIALSEQRVVFEQRLRLSDRRAQVYLSQAEAGTATSRDLASHAARLDRALEEGRELVGELAATLGLREAQLRQLGAQLRNDRQLLAGESIEEFP